MEIGYTAGPYRAPTIWGVVQNIRAAEAVAVELWRLGFGVICPHKNTALLDGANGGDAFGDADVWLKGDLEMLRRCDFVVMLPGWERSHGAMAERDFAVKRGIPVYYWPEDRQALERRAERVRAAAV